MRADAAPTTLEPTRPVLRPRDKAPAGPSCTLPGDVMPVTCPWERPRLQTAAGARLRREVPPGPRSQTASSYHGPGLHKCARPCSLQTPWRRTPPVSCGGEPAASHWGAVAQSTGQRGPRACVCRRDRPLGAGRLSEGKGPLRQKPRGSRGHSCHRAGRVGPGHSTAGYPEAREPGARRVCMGSGAGAGPQWALTLPLRL